MGDAPIARLRGQAWAEQAIMSMSSDVLWPTDTRILSRLAAMDVADLTGDRTELVQAWIEAAGARWAESRESRRCSGEWLAVVG